MFKRVLKGDLIMDLEGDLKPDFKEDFILLEGRLQRGLYVVLGGGLF